MAWRWSLGLTAGCLPRLWPTGTRVSPLDGALALTVLMAAVPGIVLTILYFTGYHSSDRHPTTAELELAVRTSLQFISLMFGTQARVLWPVSGLAALSVIASSALILVYAAIKGPAEERSCAWDCFARLADSACLAVGVGWGCAGPVTFRVSSRVISLWSLPSGSPSSSPGTFSPRRSFAESH